MKRMVLSTLTVLVLLAGPAHANDKDSAVLVNMFVWWNSAFKQENGFTEEAFAKYFTADSVMIINGRERVRGIKAMARHFRDIQSQTDEVEIILPFIESFSKDGKTFTYHKVRARTGDQESYELVMGWAEIRAGRISLINFLSVSPTPEDQNGK